MENIIVIFVTILLAYLAVIVYKNRSTVAPGLKALPEPSGALPYVGKHYQMCFDQ